MLEVKKHEKRRAPAPAREQFRKDIDAIDPALMTEVPQGEEGDKDIRDIVRKSGYLVKVANTRPSIVLKYLIGKCVVLTKYKLISDQVPTAAANVDMLAKKKETTKEELDKAVTELVKLLDGGNQKFKAPLTAALVRYPTEIWQQRQKASL